MNTETDSGLSVLVVDDHPVYRTGIIKLLNMIPGIAYYQEAENGQLAIKALEQRSFDFVLLDIQMPIMDGIEAAGIIKKRFPNTKVIVITMIDSRKQIIKMLEIGVNGYILKSTDSRELKNAIAYIMEGGIYFNPEIYKIWSNAVLKENTLSESPAKIIELSFREKEIVRMICEQMSTKQIAQRLDIAEVTANNHRSHIMKKLNADNVVAVVLYAVKTGIFMP